MILVLVLAASPPLGVSWSVTAQMALRFVLCVWAGGWGRLAGGVGAVDRSVVVKFCKSQKLVLIVQVAYATLHTRVTRTCCVNSVDSTRWSGYTFGPTPCNAVVLVRCANRLQWRIYMNVCFHPRQAGISQNLRNG